MSLERELELNWDQVTCTRGLAGAAFSQGVQQFPFSVGGSTNAMIPAYNYFTVELQVSVGDADDEARSPIMIDQLALAENFAPSLYTNVYFKAGGRSVSECTHDIPVVAAIKNRIDKSWSWIKSIGHDMTFSDAEFQSRVNRLSADGTATRFIGGYDMYRNAAAAGGENTTTIAYTVATNTLTVVPGAARNTLSSLKAVPGDVIRLITAVDTQYVDLTLTREIVAGAGLTWNCTGSAADIVATANWTLIRKASYRQSGASSLVVMFKLPIGFEDVHTPISGGDFKYELTPNANFKTVIMESIRPYLYPSVAGVPPALDAGLFDVNIQNVFLYVCSVKKAMNVSETLSLSLIEMEAMNKTMSGLSSKLDFTVPPSTFALTVFVQDGDSGSTTVSPPGRFKVRRTAALDVTDNSLCSLDETISYLQVKYGSVTKPASIYNNSYVQSKTGPLLGVHAGEVRGINKLVQRWIDTYQNVGSLQSQTGVETFEQWRMRGPIYHFDFSRDKNDASTYVSVNINYNEALPVGTQLFVVAHYTRQVDIKSEAGVVTEVTSINR